MQSANMATVLSRCLYFLIFLYHLRASEGEEYSVPEYWAKGLHELSEPHSQFLIYENNSSRMKNAWAGNGTDLAHASRSFRSVTPLLSQETLKEPVATVGTELRLGLSFGVEKPSAGAVDSASVPDRGENDPEDDPTPLRSRLLSQDRWGKYSEMCMASLPGDLQQDSSFHGLTLQTVSVMTAVEVFIFLVFICRTVHTVKAALSAFEAERHWYLEKILEERRKRQHLKEHIETVECSGGFLKNEKRHLENEIETMQQKLEVMNQLCQDRESALQQKLIQEEFEKREREEEALHQKEALSSYMRWIQEIKEEHQEAESWYKAQLAFHEKRAYDNWMKACMSEQALEEEKRETVRLRQLVEISVQLSEFMSPISEHTSCPTDHEMTL